MQYFHSISNTTSKAQENSRVFRNNPTLSPGQRSCLIKLFKVIPSDIDGTYPMRGQNDSLRRAVLFIGADGKIKEEVSYKDQLDAMLYFGAEANLFSQTFYSSFGEVNAISLERRIREQLAHYLSTYGADQMGIHVPTYIPFRHLDLPEPNIKNLSFVVIREMPFKDCVLLLNDYLKNLVAPSHDVGEDIKVLLSLTTLKTDEIKSFEIQAMKHKMDGTVPTGPVNQLRYLVYITTGESLLIKNQRLYDAIKMSENRETPMAFEIFNNCEMSGFASIFLRYKPIFLAFKSHRGCSSLINTLRRETDKYREPLNQECLQNFLHIEDRDAQDRVLAKASNRDLVKLLDSMYARASIGANETAPGVYAIRNGRIFVKEDGLKPVTNPQFYPLVDRVLETLVRRLRPILSGKTFYMPDYIEYSVPTSEKQFIGNIPYGSYICAPKGTAFTAGIHWFNQGGRTDLDLHMNSADEHFGWNGGYSNGNEVVYTGDLTDASLPFGAAEAYWFNPQGKTYNLNINQYCGEKEAEFKFFMTTMRPTLTNHRYTFDPNAVLFPPISLKFHDSTNMNLGMFFDNEFYFYGGQLGSGIVPTANYEQFIAGFKAQITSKCNLRALLKLCYANIIVSPDEVDNMDNVISLAPEDLTVKTLTDIVDGNY